MALRVFTSFIALVVRAQLDAVNRCDGGDFQHQLHIFSRDTATNFDLKKPLFKVLMIISLVELFSVIRFQKCFSQIEN